MNAQKNLETRESESMPSRETAQGANAREDARYFETVIIGTGFSGLLAAIRLQKKHCNDFVLLERSSELGGTWQVNSYPGAEVDIPTSLYSISFIAYPFKKTFSPQSELLEYTNHVIDKFGLRKQARTNQTVTRLTYDESAGLWHVETESGETILPALSSTPVACWRTRTFPISEVRKPSKDRNSTPDSGITRSLMKANVSQ